MKKYYYIVNGFIFSERYASDNSTCPEGYIEADSSEVKHYSNGAKCLAKDFNEAFEAKVAREKLIKETSKFLTKTVQDYMDSMARTRNYDNIASACSYANSSIPKFAEEGKACSLWRDQVWIYCYEQLDKFERGERSIPSAIELITELPKLKW